MQDLPRPRPLALVERTLRENPVCVLLGPRQCGKTTLAGIVASRRGRSMVFDLETAGARRALAEPETALSPLRGLVVIDEVQRLPGLFETLRPLADRRGTPARFLLLGSASPDLVRGASESLAGRAGFVDLGGFDLGEIGDRPWRRLWVRGGFPRSFLAPSEAASLRWRRDFIRTCLERDIPALGIGIPPETLRRFWAMLAHYHGRTWNGAELSRSLGIGEMTVRRYLDVLAGTYLVRQLRPWFENISKRQVRSPKVFIRDTGLLHGLLGIRNERDLLLHPLLGASWEGFALEQVLSMAPEAESYGWGTQGGAELDLLLLHGGRRYGVEFKHADAPGMTRSLFSALEDLRLERAWIVHPGSGSYRVHPRVKVVPLAAVAEHIPFLRTRGPRSAGRRR